MFVPRQLQKKSLCQQQKESTPLAPTEKSTKNDYIDPTLAKEMVMTLEILFSDHGIESGPPEWFSARMRSVEGESDFIHLSALLDCPLLAEMKPKPSQMTLRKALTQYPSDFLQLSKDKYYIRRRQEYLASSRSPAGHPKCSEDSTIYIEPHVTGITLNPGRVARMLSQSAMPRKYLPVQFVEAGDTAWAFVILSAAVSHEDAENQGLWPKDWIIMTKHEWRKRDEEYQHLRGRRPTSPARIRLPERHDGASGSSVQQMWSDLPIFPTVPVDPASVREGDQKMNADYESGLIVYLTNIHPLTTKETITSFITRQVDRYNGKKRSSTLKDRDGPPVNINYVDYSKGLTTAYLRLRKAQDSELVVSALKKRKRRMQDGNDKKGKKVTNDSGRDNWVKATNVEGNEERIYWEKVLAAKWKGKGKNKRKLPSHDAGESSSKQIKFSD
ncbi:unnamed protein product [Tuber melanosporum]|uniref:(Perigord truffle) hypothetical protein n=1 Tax=Tuber melanosporum (strain Mel28) TaxID=656061 RepID=D5G7R8_TUBMM|nr:uncharacterized protein GSTUM_00004695001 [Tuber melanosporum]CAZ80561.1 unnamed protein product [Tuber melanosporum]